MNASVRRAVAAAAVVALALALAGPVPGAEVKPVENQAGVFMGAVATLDSKARLLQVKGEKSTMPFEVAKDAKITIAGKQNGTLEDIKPGNKVEVGYTVQKGVNVADAITLKEKETVSGRRSR
jgi:hypothetical protein